MEKAANHGDRPVTNPDNFTPDLFGQVQGTFDFGKPLELGKPREFQDWLQRQQGGAA